MLSRSAACPSRWRMKTDNAGAIDQPARSAPPGHDSATMHMHELAGLDAELAEALDRLDAEPACNPLYPDVPGVLAAIQEASPSPWKPSKPSRRRR
jgi:hypothetical protein